MAMDAVAKAPPVSEQYSAAANQCSSSQEVVV